MDVARPGRIREHGTYTDPARRSTPLPATAAPTYAYAYGFFAGKKRGARRNLVPSRREQPGGILHRSGRADADRAGCATFVRGDDESRPCRCGPVREATIVFPSTTATFDGSSQLTQFDDFTRTVFPAGADCECGPRRHHRLGPCVGVQRAANAAVCNNADSPLHFVVGRAVRPQRARRNGRNLHAARRHATDQREHRCHCRHAEQHEHDREFPERQRERLRHDELDPAEYGAFRHVQRQHRRRNDLRPAARPISAAP